VTQLDLQLWPAAIDKPEVREAVDLWLAYRKERRLPTYKPIGFRSFLGRLAALGPARAVAAIHYSISQNYQGVFEEKGNGQLPLKPQATENRLSNLDRMKGKVQR